jgi:hypothetical protein
MITEDIKEFDYIKIDINKAKKIWKEKIRIARKPALEKLDIDFIRSQEQGNDTSDIVADKKTLRDLPQQVDKATTVEEIKSVWNDKLEEIN